MRTGTASLRTRTKERMRLGFPSFVKTTEGRRVPGFVITLSA